MVYVSPVAYRSPLRSNHWKYVGDITIAEVVLRGSSSNIRSDLDDISKWAQENSMNPNPKKCKEMRLISFLRIDPEVPLLEVNNTPLEKVQTHKVLGVTFCDNLKWNSTLHRKLLTKRLNGCI